jgi:hypothetical protein
VCQILIFKTLLTNNDVAIQWVQKNVLNFYPSVKIKYVNEVNPVGVSSQFAKFILPAIQNIYQAIRAKGLQDQIEVSSAIDMTLIGNLYPPSKGSFRSDRCNRSHLDPFGFGGKRDWDIDNDTLFNGSFFFLSVTLNYAIKVALYVCMK